MGLLKDILVLDLADDQGSFCSKLLADLGAAVVKVENLQEDRARTKNPHFFFYSNTNKLAAGIDLETAEGNRAFRELLKRADVLIESFDPNESRFFAFSPRRLCRLNPRLIHISITHVGRTGLPPHSQGAGVPGNTFEPPGCRPAYTASLYGAIAALMRLRKRRITGSGSYFDLSIHEAAASMLEREMAEYLNGMGNSYPADKPGSPRFSILRCRDGYVQIPVLYNWDTLLELMISRGKAGKSLEKQWNNPADREKHIGSIVAAVEGWTRLYSRRELLHLGQSLGFPWASVDSIAEARENPQLRYRRFFAHAPLWEGGPTVFFPGPPYRFSGSTHTSPKPISHPGNHFLRIPEAPGTGKNITGESISPKSAARYADEKTLDGLRVIDLTRMISGPYTTRILADYGAEVIKVQSKKTAHGAERNDTFHFSVWNRNKRSITLDLDLPEARERLLKLVADSDILVENYSPRVMANWGLHYERLKEVKPDLVMLSISAMGHTGPWRDFVGFAPTFHALSGFLSATSGDSNPPVDIEYPYADLIAGLYGALAVLSALEHRDWSGKGQHIDLSALEAICTLLGPAFIESQLDSGFGNRESKSGGEERPQSQLQDMARDARLAARRFFVSFRHPVFGRVVSARTALWDWRRKPRWKPSPLLGEANGQFEIRDS